LRKLKYSERNSKLRKNSKIKKNLKIKGNSYIGKKIKNLSIIVKKDPKYELKKKRKN